MKRTIALTALLFLVAAPAATAASICDRMAAGGGAARVHGDDAGCDKCHAPAESDACGHCWIDAAQDDVESTPAPTFTPSLAPAGSVAAADLVAPDPAHGFSAALSRAPPVEPSAPIFLLHTRFLT